MQSLVIKQKEHGETEIILNGNKISGITGYTLSKQSVFGPAKLSLEIIVDKENIEFEDIAGRRADGEIFGSLLK